MLKRYKPLKRTPLLRRSKPIRRVSKKRAAENRIYSRRRRWFLAGHPICQWWLGENGWVETYTGIYTKNGEELTGLELFLVANPPLSEEVHHCAGRSGSNFLNEATWMAVSRQGHRWIHENPGKARERGYITK